MHVHFVGSPNLLYPEPMGAIESYVFGLSKALSKKITVSLSGFGNGSLNLNNYFLKTYCPISYRAFRYFPEQRLRGMICGAIHNTYAIKNIINIHKEQPIDILHINTLYSIPFAILCKRLLGIPFVCSVHNELLTSCPLFFL